MSFLESWTVIRENAATMFAYKNVNTDQKQKQTTSRHIQRQSGMTDPAMLKIQE